MNKIEKLELNINHLELNQITKKLNEIIDVLNQKQPEGWVEPTGKKAKPIWTEKNQEQYDALMEKVEPEKQEEWREERDWKEELRKFPFIRMYLLKEFKADNLREQSMADILTLVKDKEFHDLIDFISQLLSERTLDKEKFYRWVKERDELMEQLSEKMFDANLYKHCVAIIKSMSILDFIILKLSKLKEE